MALPLLIAAVLLAAPATQPSPASPVPAATQATIRDAIHNRLAAMERVRVTYELTQDFPLTQFQRKTATAPEKGQFTIVYNGIYRFTETLSLLDARTRLDSRMLQRTPILPERHALLPIERTYVFAPGRAQKLVLYATRPGRDPLRAKGWVRHATGLAPSTLEVALGMRVSMASPGRLTPANLGALRLVRVASDAPDLVRLVGRDEFWVVTWVLDRRLGYSPVAYSIHTLYDDCDIAVMTMADFRTVGGLQLPFSITQRTLCRLPNGKLWVTCTETLGVKDYRFNSPDNTPDLYWIDWPEGTPVRDDTSNQDLIVRHGVLKPAPPSQPVPPEGTPGGHDVNMG